MRCRHTILCLMAVLLTACSETKYVAENSYLLDRVRVRTDDGSGSLDTERLKGYVRQVGNARWFSTLKIPLYTYNLSGRDTTRWLNRTLRAIGEPPVVYDSALTMLSVRNIQQQVANEGFLRAAVDVKTKRHGRKLTAEYYIHSGPAYHIRQMHYDISDSAIARLLRFDVESNRGLHGGMRFNIDNLEAERKRITSMLTEQGFYRFNKDFISYRADSLAGTTDIDLTLMLHRYHVSNEEQSPHRQYRIGSVNYLSGNSGDTLIHLRQKVLRHNTYLQEGTLYSSSDLQSTYNHFARLGAVRYTNILFRERPDTTLLDCDITISTNKPSTISFQPEGTNTAGDLGAAATLTYQNRNIFHGSEALSVELRGAFEAITGLEGYSNNNFLEYSARARLTFPRFIAPWLPQTFHRRINATSEVSVAYDLQNRPEFLRRVFSVGWRYNWYDPRHHDRYQIDLLDLNFITMPWVSDKFYDDYLDDAASRNALLLFNYQDLFIMRTGFRFSYNNGRYAIKTNIETGGNLLSLMAKSFGFHRDEDGQYTFLDVAFAQYVKADIDYTRYFQLDFRNQLVFHVGLGIAYPYGNSDLLPFEKMYFSGGANGVRGWSVRSLGPGKFTNEAGSYNFLLHTGDLKLDVNLEYRAHLFWKLGGALFVDAGNIWNLREYEGQKGGVFKPQEFWQQLAVSYGLGFRFNFDYFILRFDMGMKAVNPVYNNHREHFPLLYPKLSRDFAFHFAVGLPF